MNKTRTTLWLFLAITAYSAAQFIWYWQTPLGQSPVLDGQENLILANQISEGTLPDEPFYRAILYPALLAFTPLHWMALGFLLHLANACLAYRISRLVWQSALPAQLTAAFMGFNPVLLHFAADPLDITFSLTLFLSAALAAASGAAASENRNRRFAASGILITLACLARPHFFALLIPLTLVAFILLAINKRARAASLALLLPILLILTSFSILQKVRSDSFRILPWQGPFNLWASNHSHANGLYYTQSLNFHYTGEHQNPARLESEELYRQETKKEPAIDPLNAFWRSKTIDSISENPLRWFKLMGFKAYALLNNVEQYNNKTYSFHKRLSPVLVANPIGWGLLFALAAFALPKLYKTQPTTLLLCFCLFALYAAGVLLYMASARFRLPLVPILSILAGGGALVIRDYAQQRKIALLAAPLILALLAGLFSFSRFANIDDEKTFTQDALLLADASARLGRDQEAFDWSQQALALDPSRPDAKRLRLISYYNLVASNPTAETPLDWSALKSDTLSPLSDPILEYVRGVAFWNLNQTAEAQATWLNAFQRYGWQAHASLSALIYTESPQLPTNLPPRPPNLENTSPQLAFAIKTAPPRPSLDPFTSIFAKTELTKPTQNTFANLFPRILPQP